MRCPIQRRSHRVVIAGNNQFFERILDLISHELNGHHDLIVDSLLHCPELGLLEEQTGDAAAAMEHYQTAFKHAPALADPKVNPEILSSKLQLGAQVRHFGGERFEKGLPMQYMQPAEVRKMQKQFSEPSMPRPTPTAAPAAGVTVQPTPTPTTAAEEGSEAGSAARSTSTTAGAGAAGGAAVRGGSRGSGGSSTTEPRSGSTPYGVPTPVPPSGSSGGTAGAVGGAPRIGSTSPEARLRPPWPGLHDIVNVFV